VQDPVDELAPLLLQHRAEIVERATDWVVAAAMDLQGKRPRAETQRLVERVVAWNEALLLHGNDGPLLAFIEFVTTFRAESEFRVSTLLKGFASFRMAMGMLLTEQSVEPLRAVRLLQRIDEAYLTAIFAMTDEYVRKLNHTIVQRRTELERELAALTALRSRELDERAALIAMQHEVLQQVSLPVVRVFAGVLVLPLIGLMYDERATQMLERLLAEVAKEHAQVVIVDITGMIEVEETALLSLQRAMTAVGLLGAKGMIVGITSEMAIRLVKMPQFKAKALRTYASLDEGLRVALQLVGFGITRLEAPGLRRPSTS
jgi:anti-anti-sigma regulatory factor